LLVAPSGLTIDPETGLITWETTPDDIANHAVVVQASDGRGGTALQTFTLAVIEEPPNRPPIFTSTPEVDAFINQLYQYDADAIDPDQDELAYSLILGPDGMTLHPDSGEVEWTPPPVLNLGDTVLGRASIPGDNGEFSFSGVAGQRIYFDPLQFSGSAGDWNFEVYSPSGEQLLATNLATNQILNLGETGTYRIIVDANGDHTGTYGFSAIDLGLVPIAPLDTVIEGSLSPGSEDDIYRFTGNAGQKLFFDKISNTNSLDWVLYDATNQVVALDHGFNDMEIYLPTDGEYMLALRGKSRFEVTADYAFEIITPEEITTPLNLGNNTNPNVISTEISEKGEEDIYTFTGHPGQRLYFDRLFQNGTAIWAHSASIISPSGRTVFNHNLQSPFDPHPIILDESGTYQVRLDASGEQTGSYSYSLLDLDLASPIVTDTPYSSTLDSGQETHLYQFAGNEGQRLYLDVPGDSAGANWTLYDSRNQRVTGGSLNSDLEVVLNDSETYTLAIQGHNGPSPVDYSFEVITPDEVVKPLDIGQIVESEIFEKGEQDIYTFTGSQGQRLFLDTLQNKPLVEATLVSPSGHQVFNRVRLHDDRSRNPFILQEDGTYQLIIDGSGETTDSYGFQLLDLDTAPNLQPETSIQDTLDPGRSIQVYQLSGNEGDRVYFDNQADSSNANHWRLYGPGNQKLEDTRLNLDFETVLPATGTYYLLLQGEEDSPVPYDIQWVPTTTSTTSLNLNSSIQGEIDKLGEQDRYIFNGVVGQTLYFVPRAGDNNTIIEIYNPSGNRVLSGHTGSDSPPLVLTEAGEYELIVNGREDTTGTYDFILTDTAPELSLGTRLSGDLDAGEIIFYQLDGSRGQQLDFESLSAAPEADWILYAPTTLPEGNKVVTSVSLSNDFTQVLPVDGRYILALRNPSDEVVGYDIQVNDISASAVTTAGLDTLYSDTIATGGEIDVYPIDANAGSLILFDGQGNRSTQRVRLFNPDGTLVFSNLDNRNDAGPYQITQTGSYSLEVYGQPSSSTGNYQFQLVDLQAAPNLTLDRQVDVALAGKATKVLQFNGSAGQQLWLDGLNTSNPNVTATVFNESGRILATLNDLRNNIELLTLEADGDYYLALQSDNTAATTASFRLLDAATANVLSLDSDISGNFGTSRRETQLYRFNGDKDQRLYFNGSGDRDNIYQVYGPDGQRLFSFPISGDFEIAALPADGEYTLALIGTGKANNSYEMQIVTPEPSEIPLVIGETITGAISETGEQTTYTFEGNENQHLFFDSLTGDALGITLYSPSGVQLWHGQRTHIDRAPTILNETGTYRLVVDGSQDLTSSYSFRLLDLDEATPINLDSEIADDFGSSLREAHLYRFDGTAEQPLFFDRTVGAGARFGISNYYALYGPDGEPFVLPKNLKFDDETILPIDGEYTLVVGGGGELDPNYALELVTPDWLPPVPYTIGDTLSSNLSEAGERDTFTFAGSPGQQLVFDSLLRADNINAKLVAPSGNIVWQQHSLSNDRTPFTLLEAGTYTLEIDGVGDVVDDYRFRLLDLAADATPISLDASLNGNFGPSAREMHIYRFSAPAAQRLYFDRSTGSAFNNYALYDEHGQLLLSQRFDRDYEGSEDLLSDTGNYTLILSGNSNPNHAYSLEVVTPEIITTPHQLGDILSGEIGDAGEQDIYTFEGSVGQQLWLDSLDSTGSGLLRLELLAPNGEEIFDHGTHADSGATDLVTLPADGTYRIVVDGSGDTTGNYRFRFLEAATADALPLDTPISGNFGTSQQEAQIHTFTSNEGQYLYVDSSGGIFANSYLLYDPDGKLLVHQSQNADFELELPKTGRYTLVADGSHEDGYQLEVVTPVLTETPLILGETVASRIDEAGEQETYLFTGTVGQQLYFDALVGDTSLRAQLYSPSGKLIEDWPTSHNGSPVTLTESGSYRLVLDGINTATGDYQFRLSDLAAVPSLQLDAIAEDTLDPGHATVLYQIAGEPGQVLSFDLEAEQWHGANWVLYGPGDTVIAAPQQNDPDFDVTLPASGVYTLAIVGTATTPLDYRFQVNDQTPAPVLHTGLNTTISGTLTAGDIIEHPFSATAGTQILLDSLNNSNAQIRFNLVNPDGSLAFTNLDSRLDSAPLLLEQSGDYTLQIYGFHPSTAGNYALQLIEVPPDSTSEQFNRLEPGIVTTGTLSPGLEAELYSFEGKTGQKLLFNGIEGSNVTAILYAPTGDPVFSTSNYRSSDVGPLTLNQDGLYHLVIKGEQTTDRDYAFQLFNFDAGQPIPFNLPVAGHLPSGQQSELYKFTGTADDTLFFDSLQGSFRHSWKLYGPDGEQLHSTRLGSDFEVKLPADGDYTLSIEGNSSATPLDYEFRVFRQSDDPNFVITPGTGETASNDDDSLGLFPVQIEVSDGQGGTDIQDYKIRLWPDPDNTSPVITSNPNTRYGLNQTAYRYQLDSLDADGDSLTYRLVDAPLGALIDADSGELLWFPEDVAVGESYDFTVDVSDGRGGSDRQSFSVEIHDVLGTIQGAVFEDLNNNGYRDNNLIVGDDPDFYFVIDTSGSMGRRTLDWTDPNLTLENFDDSQVTSADLQMAAIVAMIEQISQQSRGTDSKIAIKAFEDGRFLDMDPHTPGHQPFATATADSDNDGILNVREALQNAAIGGGISAITGTEVTTALNLADSLPDERTLNVIFMSDGFISVPREGVEELHNHPKINVAAFSIGAGSLLQTMQILDPDAVMIEDPNETFNIFTGWDERYTTEPLMENVTVYLDLNENGQLDAGEPQQQTQPDDQNSLLGENFFQFRFDNLLPGTYTLRQVIPPGFEETAPPNGSYIDTITVDVAEVPARLFGNHAIETVNHDPAFISTPPSDALVPGEVLHYQALAVDPDPDPLTYDLPLAPEGMVIDAETGDLVWVPRAEQVGSYTVIARVQDGQGGQELQTFEVEVVPPNTAPTFTSTPPNDVSPQVGKPFQYQAAALDADGDPLTYELLPDVPNGITIDPITGLLLWTPLVGQLGQQEVNIKVSDGRGGEATQTLVLSVIEPLPNTAPTITSTPRQEIRLGNGYLYQLAVEEPDGDPLSFTLVAAPEGMTIDDEGLVVWTPTASQIGNHEVEVEVSDGQGGRDTQRYALKVSSQVTANRPPSITSVPQTLTNLDRLYQYQLAGIDPDGDVLFWSLLQAPAGMAVDGETGALRWQPTADQIGDHTVVIQAIDALGQTAVQEFTLQVNGINTPPAIVSTPITSGAVNQPYAYAVTATDPENDLLRFSLGVRPEGMTIDAETGLIEWTPTHTGSQTVEVLVEDGQGGSNRQFFTLEVGDEVLNHAPSITSTPIFLADTNQPYVYPVTALDPDGDDLTFELVAAPAGITIDADTGEVTWTEPVLGNHQVVVSATDGALGAAQGFTLTVQDNQPPVFDAAVTPPATAIPDRLYRYDVRAFDPNGGPLTYRLDAASQDLGMTLDEVGRLRWTPTQADAGNHSVTIEVVDAQGTTASQTFEIAVTADTEAPLVNLQVNNVFVTSEGFEADLGTEVSFQVLATDNVAVEDMQLVVDGEPVQLDANGIATVTLASAGTLTALAVATDAAGNRGEATASVFVPDPSDTVGPQVSLDISRIEDGVITALTDIFGTVTDENLEFYTLEVAPVDGSAPFVEIARGTDEVMAGVLGKVDPTTLLSDSYRLRLTARDGGGNVSIAEEVVHVEGALKLGNFQVSFTDLNVPVSGIPISVTRTYDSLSVAHQDNFGYGWRLEFRDTDLRTSLGPDEQYEILGIPSKAFQEGTKVFVTPPGGERTSFTFEPEIDPAIQKLLNAGAFVPPGLILYNPKFVAEDGSELTLSVQDEKLIRNRHTGEFYSVSGYAYNPAVSFFGGTYTLTTEQGVEYEIDGESGDLLAATDANGNQLTFSDGGIFSDTGRNITFERDAQDRIVALIDPEGNRIEYAYDDQGDLVAVTDREGNTTEFVYDVPDRPHYLNEIIDPLGRSGIRTEYDSEGRLASFQDASGQAIGFSYDPDNQIEVITDPLGNTTIFEYDERGNTVQLQDALGGITRFSYDENNNLLSETDALGNTVSFTYDTQGNLLSETDPLGNTTYYTYDKDGNLITFTDSLGNTTTYTYDRFGNPTSATDALGNVSEMTLDAQGNPTSISFQGVEVGSFEFDEFGQGVKSIDPLGNARVHTFDAKGNVVKESITVTTPAGPQTLETNYEYNANGQVTAIIDPEGRTTRLEYDSLGRETAIIDPLGQRTEFTYDERGNLIAIDYADGSQESMTYDAIGQLIATTDAIGRTTHYEYDALGRQTGIIYPDDTPNDLSDNLRELIEYDAIGQVIAEVDVNGNRVEYSYDAAGQQSSVDIEGFVTTFTYDEAGRRTSETNALGQTTQYVYDANGLLAETIYPDGTSLATVGTFGEGVQITDASGNVTQFETNAKNELVAVVDALGQRTEYTHDELGNLISQTDANGNVTRYEYDSLGFRTAVILPDGERSSIEYDALGNPAQSIDFNGAVTLYEYDDLNRLTRVILEDDGELVYTYDEAGQLERITDTTGTTVQSYDDEGRLISRTTPDGLTLRYAYGADGEFSVTSPTGTTTYIYDDQQRLVEVNDSLNGTVRYRYEANNLVETELANGTVERRRYNDLNQLIELEHQDVDGTILLSQTFTHSLTGDLLKVEENSGRSVEYAYDVLGRLIGETITDGVEGDRTITYTYDAVGNRLERNDSVEGVTAYTYNSRNQLTSSTHDGEVTVYVYDENGNRIEESSDSVSTVYEWDGLDRLIKASITEGGITQTVEYEYNHDGIRTAKIVDGERTDYLIDVLQPYVQVREEYRPDGSVVSYTHGQGAGPTAQHHSDLGSLYYHGDHLDSTRLLTDGSGEATADRYLYDAYGRMLTPMGNSEVTHLFTGESFDADVGLQYLRERFLDVDNGIFVRADKFEGIESSPITRHPYLYANANPVAFTDPSGFFSLGEVNVVQVMQNTLRKIKQSQKLKKFLDLAGGATDLFATMGIIVPLGLHLAMMYYGTQFSPKQGFAAQGSLTDPTVFFKASFPSKKTGALRKGAVTVEHKLSSGALPPDSFVPFKIKGVFETKNSPRFEGSIAVSQETGVTFGGAAVFGFAHKVPNEGLLEGFLVTSEIVAGVSAIANTGPADARELTRAARLQLAFKASYVNSLKWTLPLLSLTWYIKPGGITYHGPFGNPHGRT